MKKIYVVTSGEYSDYGIDAVFTTKELAEKHVSTSYGTIEEYPLNPNEKIISQGKKGFKIEMCKDGSLYEHGVYSFSHEDLSKRNTYCIRQYNSPEFNAEFVEAYVLAHDEKHAIKIVNEQRLQLIASGKWGSNNEKYKYTEGKFK